MPLIIWLLLSTILLDQGSEATGPGLSDAPQYAQVVDQSPIEFFALVRREFHAHTIPCEELHHWHVMYATACGSSQPEGRA